MDNDKFYRAVGNLDEEFLQEFEKLERMEEKEMIGMKKSVHWITAAACCVLLMGAGVTHFLQQEFTGGNIFTWHNEAKQGYSYEQNTTADEVYEERDDGFYYIFQGAEVEISAYCSETDYFLAPCLDDNGTGYVVVIGGEKGARGFLLKHFEEGDFFIGHGYHEIYGSEISWKPEENQDVAASYPQLAWNHHATHLLGYTLSEEWFGENLPEMLSTSLGDANKTDHDFFYVKGNKLDFYTPYEESNYIYEELFLLRRMNPEVDWLKNIFVTDPIDFPEVQVEIREDWTEEREAELRAVLDETGIPYHLEFIEKNN